MASSSRPSTRHAPRLPASASRSWNPSIASGSSTPLLAPSPPAPAAVSMSSSRSRSGSSARGGYEYYHGLGLPLPPRMSPDQSGDYVPRPLVFPSSSPPQAAAGAASSIGMSPTLSGDSGSRAVKFSNSSVGQARYPSVISVASSEGNSRPTSMALLSSAAQDWETIEEPEADDYLHIETEKDRSCWHGIDFRGFLNIVAVLAIILGLLMLFAGYPILQHTLDDTRHFLNINSTGQVPELSRLPQLIDPDTPQSAYKWTSLVPAEVAGGADYELVFSDEFETEGRTFWPGDDPFWEAPNFWYGATNDYEWYHPEAINTTGGALHITMTQKANHNLNFQSGMLQSWNKLCFQGGYLEMAVKLPGLSSQRGYWPGMWTMGNLGRPGYRGTTEGTWPYSYDTCDWGTLPNQTNPEKTLPEATIDAHGQYSAQYGNKLSFMPGQKLSACTCPGEDHPGPHTGVGRGAPEVDILEAQNSGMKGQASQSLQICPFSQDYLPVSNSSYTQYNNTGWNNYRGGVFQQAMSGVSPIPDSAYRDAPDAEYYTFGVQMDPDFDGDGSRGQLAWYSGGQPTWSASAGMVGPQASVNVSQRLVPVEPMTIVLNLAVSAGFSQVHWDELVFPAVMSVDYVRLYQRPGQHRLDCSPSDHPTKDYIDRHLEVYNNPNYTAWPQDQYAWPKNRLMPDTC